MCCCRRPTLPRSSGRLPRHPSTELNLTLSDSAFLSRVRLVSALVLIGVRLLRQVQAPMLTNPSARLIERPMSAPSASLPDQGAHCFWIVRLDARSCVLVGPSSRMTASVSASRARTNCSCRRRKETFPHRGARHFRETDRLGGDRGPEAPLALQLQLTLLRNVAT